MIRNADLYDLINLSLRSNELKNEQVEQFIQKALVNKQSTDVKEKYADPGSVEYLFTTPSKFIQNNHEAATSSFKESNDHGNNGKRNLL